MDKTTRRAMVLCELKILKMELRLTIDFDTRKFHSSIMRLQRLPIQ